MTRVVGRLFTLRRLVRDPVLVATTVAIAVLVVGVGWASTDARVAIVETIDENWRGAYDILVRPANTRLDLERTNGVVEPNFLAFAGSGGISVATVETIRGLDGVDLAAPISTVGLIRPIVVSPFVFVSTFPDVPTLYDLSLEAWTSDGLDEILIQRYRLHALLGPPESRDLFASDFASTSNPLSISGRPGWLASPRTPLPAISSPLIAIDPDAEIDLLGGDPFGLASLKRVQPSQRTLRDFDKSLGVGLYGRVVSRTATIFADMAAQGILDSTNAASALGRPVVPLVVSERLYSPITLRLTVDEVGTLDTFPPTDSPAASRIDSALEDVQPTSPSQLISERDISDDVRPFQGASAVIPWPGSELPQGTVYSAQPSRDLDARLTLRPSYAAGDQPRPSPSLAFTIEPVGPVSPEANPAPLIPVDPDATFEVGVEQSYRQLVPTPLAFTDTYQPVTPEDSPYYLLPIGEFNLEDLPVSSNPLNYVPLGTYVPPDTRLIERPGGEPTDETSVLPTLNPAGLIAAPPLAITDIAGAEAIRGDNAIDAVRVRVAGIDNYSPENVNKVEKVATAIHALGLDVDIVAGSSPQKIDIWVPNYHVQRSTDRDLGWVRQEWTTLGAAEQIETGLSKVDAVLVGFAISVAAVGVVALQVLRSSTQRHYASILNSIGWSTGTIRAWLAAPALALSAALAVVGVAIWVSKSQSPAIGLAMLAVVLSLPVGSIAGSFLSTRRLDVTAGVVGDMAANPRQRWIGLTGPITYAIRSHLARPTRIAVTGLATGIGGAGIGIALAVLAHTLVISGSTNLAGAVRAVLLPYEWAIIIVGGLTLLILAGALMTMNESSQAPDRLILGSCGWSPATLRTLVRTQRLLTVLFALVVAEGVALLFGLIQPRYLGASLAFASGAIVVVSVFLAFHRREHT